MQELQLHRRGLLTGAGAVVLGMAAPYTARAEQPAKPRFRYCLNTSTIREAVGDWGKARPILDGIAIAAKAGYDAIEPWIQELDEYTKGGGTLADLKKRISDAGLAVPNAIGFAEWVVDDETRRKKGLEQAKRDMEKVLAIGGAQLAAPPVGATAGGSRRDDPKTSQAVSAQQAADRYGALQEIGTKLGVKPLVELWGHSASLRQLGEAALTVLQSSLPDGAILPDVYHLYKGGSPFHGVGMLAPNTIGIFHVNDYPKIERSTIKDQDRVFPGDGIAPLKELFSTLATMKYTGYLSLELFNTTYWKQDPNTTARTGLEKLKALAEVG